MTKRMPLSQGKFALVDDGDFERVKQYRWYAHKSGSNYYAIGNRIYMHRLILDAPNDMIVDHINGNGLDNRRSNLRLCSHAENQRNTGPRKKNRSGYKGVYQAHGKKWKALIGFDGKTTLLGHFDTPEEAARAYDRAARELHGDFAKLNFPD